MSEQPEGGTSPLEDDDEATAQLGAPQPPVPFTPPSGPCPNCGDPVAAGANFCEACGAQLGEVTASVAQAGPRVDRPGSVPISAPTHLVTDDGAEAPRRPCAECGGTVGPDLYCEQCGTKAPSERDHFRESPAPWVAGVCDRGARRNRNEDAMALAASASPGEYCALIVLDGVSSSTDSDVASLAGARAAREVLRTPLPLGLGTLDSRDAAAHKAITDAAEAAQQAIVAHTESESENPASATFTCVLLAAEADGPMVWHGNLGDSRTYWVPDEGPAVQLSRDDSAAEALIATGMDREEALASEQAHAITRWLGRDAQDVVPTIGRLTVEQPGWLLACSDGLWNYARETEELGERVRAVAAEHPGDVEAMALALVQFATGAGGHDNITAALARVGPLPEADVRETGDNHPDVDADVVADVDADIDADRAQRDVIESDVAESEATRPKED
ncbi:MAG: protein phosphatase 2C domain-containing protein [Actinomycetia bacterium]|nr:protein phosphatase 2C domain-containing protein [Actinomycetes bacterium]